MVRPSKTTRIAIALLTMTSLTVSERAVGAEPQPAAAPPKAGTRPVEDLTAEYKGNRLAFRARYDGQVIQVAGVVKAVLDSSSKTHFATVSVRRQNVVDPDAMVLSDSVDCFVTDRAQTDILMQLAKGKPVVISGRYEAPKRKHASESRVALHDCTVQAQ